MIRMNIEHAERYIAERELQEYLEQNREVLESVKKPSDIYQASLGWFDVDEWAGDKYLREILKVAQRVRQDADVFVLIGIGGSNNGARAVIKAVQKSGPEIAYAGNNISAKSISDLLEYLEGKSVYINVIAKNFETLEPGIAFRVLRTYLEKRYGEEANKRIIATGTPGSLLHQISKEQNYEFLAFPENIGGRFSAISNVGMLPMAVAGVDIEKLADGAKDMQLRLMSEKAEENIAFRYAGIRSLLYQRGYKVEMLAFFEPCLAWFSKWWIQLFAESEGKDGKGLFPIGGDYTEELHSVGQFVQDGSSILFETFLDIQDEQASQIIPPSQIQDGFEYLNGVDYQNINKAAYNATLKAHCQKLPCVELHVPQIDEYIFGQLFYLFEFSCFLSCSLLGVNPFDQPGVESYKGYMFESLGKYKV